MIWFEGINSGTEYARVFSELLLPDFNFKEWLTKGEIEHDSLNISFADLRNVLADKDYAEAIKNNYYHKVGFINDHRVKETKSSIEELKKLPTFKDDKEFFYTFRIKDLDHLVSLYFQHWLIFNSYHFWVKWQVYYDFIVRKSEKLIGGLYQYRWTVTLGLIESYTHAFDTVDQYKQFRDKLDSLTTDSKFVEESFIKVRDSKKNK